LPEGYAQPFDPVEDLSLTVADRVGRLASLLPRMWRAFRDNPGLWGALKEIAYKDQRDAGFLSVTGWLMGKVLA
jgi:hypothetical protein